MLVKFLHSAKLIVAVQCSVGCLFPVLVRNVAITKIVYYTDTGHRVRICLKILYTCSNFLFIHHQAEVGI